VVGEVGGQRKHVMYAGEKQGSPAKGDANQGVIVEVEGAAE
jgi:hypothetical protein